MGFDDNHDDGSVYKPPHMRFTSNGASGGFSRGRGRGNGGNQGNRNNNSNFNNSRSYGGRYSGGSGGGGSYSNNQRSDVDWDEHLAPNSSIESNLFKGSNTGIKFDDYDNIPVNVSGPDLRKQDAEISNFSELDLHPIIKDNIQLCNYDKPTPVQKHAVPVIAAKRDLMACAQTGSGKTAAFLIPILNSMYKEGAGESLRRSTPRCKFPVALIMAPTRELAIQIYEEGKKFAYRSHVRCCVAYGGAAAREQLFEIQRGCNLLVATPGRLKDFLSRGAIDLSCCRFLVLDEADRMLDMGFEPQIREIVEGHMMRSDDIQQLAHDFLKDYVFLTVGRVGSTSENITQSFHFVEEHDKRTALVDILKSHEVEHLTLIFVETKRGADALEDFLYTNKFSVSSIHGDRKQEERERALQYFKSGQTPLLIATAVAARGLDIPNVKHVINFDLPSSIDEYVHRIGRTGRVGNLGTATSFFNSANRAIARDLTKILEESKQDVPSFIKNAIDSGGYGGGYGGGYRGGRGRGGRQGGQKFGGRDFRQSSHSHEFHSGGGGGRYSNYGSSRGGGFDGHNHASKDMWYH
ncbi:ATP-dependent RNA helicase ddx3x [Cichlidogyrus casuarinus]|uniref:RNA helicase n=1 Tax=Cichlidogyrus casuarinus TaxID=1844966 RepID=A0ABD2Q0Y6_9PLAT